MELENEFKKEVKDEFLEKLDEESKKGYLFITKAFFLDADSKNNLVKHIIEDYENDNVLNKSEVEIMNKYENLLIDELRNYSVGKAYKDLKAALNKTEEENRLALVKYINLMNEYEFTYQEELDFAEFVIREYKNGKITLKEELTELMDYLENNYE